MKLTEKTKKYLVIVYGMILDWSARSDRCSLDSCPVKMFLPEDNTDRDQAPLIQGRGLETQKAPKESVEESGGKRIRDSADRRNKRDYLDSGDSRAGTFDQTAEYPAGTDKTRAAQEEMLTIQRRSRMAQS